MANNMAITSVIGLTNNSDDTKLDNDTTYGLRVDFNRGNYPDDFSINRLQLTLDYSEGAYKGFGEANVLRMGANAVWDFAIYSQVSPFILAGIGYQVFEFGKIATNTDGLYASFGGGLEVKLDDRLNFVLEGKDLLDENNNNYLLGNIGIKYNFNK
jgi:opacity protein-like surface antigen